VVARLAKIPSGSVDAIVSDPPYPEVDREYGRIRADVWRKWFRLCVREFRRVLKPKGSAMLVLQPNSERVGKLRPWLYEFLAWAANDWNIVQDGYWWNHTTPPGTHAQARVGLMRASMKHLVWLGAPDCYRDQGAVLWEPSDGMKALALSKRLRTRTAYRSPSGYHADPQGAVAIVAERGGVTPFNVLPLSNTDNGCAGGHPAAYPLALARWWVRYLTRPGELVLDPFIGSGTTAIACLEEGRRCIGIEREPRYVRIARGRIGAFKPKPRAKRSEARA